MLEQFILPLFQSFLQVGLTNINEKVLDEIHGD